MSNAASAIHGYGLKLVEGAVPRRRNTKLARHTWLPNQAVAKGSYTPFAQLGSLAFFKRMVSEPSGLVFW